MPIRKPKSNFGLEDCIWLAFVFGFLVMVFTATGCKSSEVVKDKEFFHERGGKYDQ